MRKYLIIFVVNLSLISCGTVETLENVNEDYLYLPLNSANSWTYQLLGDNSINQIEYNIISTNRHPDGTFLWGYNSIGQKTDGYLIFERLEERYSISGYYGYRDNAIYSYSTAGETVDNYGHPFEKIVLLKSPAEVGNQWISENGFKSRIIFKGPIIVQNISYPNTVLITTDHHNQIDSVWYSKNVGIVKKIEYVTADSIHFTNFRREILELKSYDIK
jgi:hypothetical protein